MRIATWNVNSLRVRLEDLLGWLAESAPDVVALQETKVVDEEFPLEELGDAGYSAVFTGERTYNGVAILSRRPPEGIVTDLPGLSDPSRRYLAATVDGVRVVSVYVPNGQAVGAPKYDYKLRFLDRLTDAVRAEMASHPRLVILGDYNIAPEDRDVHDPVAWRGKALFSEPEKDAFRRLTDLGLVDTFRLFEQEQGSFSWWDYRMGAFRRNLGARIDHVLASEELARSCSACIVDKAPRALERPSDHAPVIATFE